jgi:hypothetical protein
MFAHHRPSYRARSVTDDPAVMEPVKPGTYHIVSSVSQATLSISLGGSSDVWQLEHSGMFQAYTIKQFTPQSDSVNKRDMYLTVSATSDTSADPPFALSLNGTSGIGGFQPHPGHDAFLEWRISSDNVGATVQLTHVVNHIRPNTCRWCRSLFIRAPRYRLRSTNHYLISRTNSNTCAM